MPAAKAVDDSRSKGFIAGVRWTLELLKTLRVKISPAVEQVILSQAKESHK
jgi:hypothetical protein